MLGDPGVLAIEDGVAIVGARRASSYGLDVARALGRGLSAAHVAVVSGLALGIDSAAHAGALEAPGRTSACWLGAPTWRIPCAAGACTPRSPPAAP